MKKTEEWCLYLDPEDMTTEEQELRVIQLLANAIVRITGGQKNRRKRRSK